MTLQPLHEKSRSKRWLLVVGFAVCSGVLFAQDTLRYRSGKTEVVQIIELDTTIGTISFRKSADPSVYHYKLTEFAGIDFANGTELNPKYVDTHYYIKGDYKPGRMLLEYYPLSLLPTPSSQSVTYIGISAQFMTRNQKVGFEIIYRYGVLPKGNYYRAIAHEIGGIANYYFQPEQKCSWFVSFGVTGLRGYKRDYYNYYQELTSVAFLQIKSFGRVGYRINVNKWLVMLPAVLVGGKTRDEPYLNPVLFVPQFAIAWRIGSKSYY